MRTVTLVTRSPDTGALAQGLERAGFVAPIVSPETFADDPAGAATDVMLLDLRDLTPAALAAITGDHADTSVLIALVPEEQLGRIAADLPFEDFLVLPGRPSELARRVERALWRRHGIDSENFVRCGAMTIDLSNYRVTIDDQALVLTFKEYELLRFLAMNAGRVFTREQLLNRVWGYDYFGDGRLVDVHIRRLRTKVEPDPALPRHILTVRGMGYKLVP